MNRETWTARDEAIYRAGERLGIIVTIVGLIALLMGWL